MMSKKTARIAQLFGFIAFVAVIGFSMAACDFLFEEEDDGSPKITTSSLPDGEVGKSYSQTLKATGDTPIKWSFATSGTLPAGLSLNASTGVISGTPLTTSVGKASFTVKAENEIGSDTKQLSITITTQPQKPGTPTGVKAVRSTTTPTTVNVTWNAVEGATSYKVYSNVAASETLPFHEGSPTTTSFDSLNQHTARFYRISAVNSAGEGSPSEWVGVGSIVGGSNTFHITNKDEWDDALLTINGTTGEYTLTIGGSFSVPGIADTSEAFAASFGATEDGSSLKVTLNGSGTLSLSSSGHLIAVGVNQTVVIDSANLTLQGRAGNNAATVVTRGTLELKNGKITGNTNTASSGYGAGVSVAWHTIDWDTYEISAGTFIMSGGEISGNTRTSTNGGGVGINSGTFTMSGGKISNNTAPYGAGVYISGTFTMSGDAEISGNTATVTSGWGGGGVHVSSRSTFTMNNGKISGNTAGSYGGGVCVSDSSSVFIMNDGEISGNKATGVYGGGGVYTGGTFTMKAGKISRNEATNPSGEGGGVNVRSGTFTMESGRISGNSTAYIGGGVYMSAGTTFTMKDGIISGNTATSDASGNGGGVYVTGYVDAGGGGTLQIVNGIIYGSNATGKDDDNIDLKNTARNSSSGAALYKGGNAIAQNGKFTGTDGAWAGNDIPLEGTYNIETTITVEEGELK